MKCQATSVFGQAIEPVSTEAYTAVLSLVLHLPLSRSERKPADKVQLSQQELKPGICLFLSNANKCACVICKYWQF